MHAYIEWLVRGRIGIVRAGRHAYHFKHPYEYACVIERSKYSSTVTAKALVADGRFSTPHRKAMQAEVRRHFPRVKWERVKKQGTRVVWS